MTSEPIEHGHDRRPALQPVDTQVEPQEPREPQEPGPGEPVDQPTSQADRTLYATILGTRDHERRAVVPPWLRNRDQLREATRWAARHTGHTAAFHTVRAPAYGGKLLARAPVGAARGVGMVARWALDAEGQPLRADAVRRGDSKDYMRLLDKRNARVRLRLLTLGGCLLAAVAGLVALLTLTPDWSAWLGLAGLLGALGVLGRPADKPLVGHAVVRHEAAKLTSGAVIRALGALGIGEINKALSDKGEGISFPAHIMRDGPGWRADIDLPPGVTATDILERRDRLASGLRRPLGCVWPEGDSTQHAGRLVLWVGDQDMNKAKQPAWPLAKRGQADVFAPVPFGTDQRGRQVSPTLMFNSVLIGAMPRQGKTFALRVLVLALALDPRVQLRTFELKGTGDLSALKQVAHQYGSGMDDATIERSLDALREVAKDLERRSATIGALSKQEAPESKVTPELAARKDLGLAPVALVIDECQELFAHPEFGAEADRLATRIIKLGPAMGIMLILATQRPDKDSLPKGISANAGIRFCLRVMGQAENDMVLGTSMYKNGARATTFTDKDKGIGYLVGVTDDPQIARSYYIDGPTADHITDRARAMREAAGTLTGQAAGDDGADQPERFTVLGDVAAVLASGEEQVWHETLLERLSQHRPDVYTGWRQQQLSTALKAYGVDTRQVWHNGANRRGITCDHVRTALAEHAAGENVRSIR